MHQADIKNTRTPRRKTTAAAPAPQIILPAHYSSLIWFFGAIFSLRMALQSAMKHLKKRARRVVHH
ncbi:MAG: hypothetical protein U0694_20975 [Anaerolineae bacterium]